MTRRALPALALAAALTAGCDHPTQRFEGVTQLVRMEVVEVDDKGKPAQIDLELEWDACPGDQYQVVRGNGEFAQCMAQYEVGELVSVHVDHLWDTRGFYEWDVAKIGECARPPEAGEGSYEKSQECSDVVDYGVKTGFRCSRRPFRDLVAICPWMARN